jgi:plasmid stabilization system protein ParE
MTKLFIAAACALTMLASACTKTGSSGSERNKTADTSTTAQLGDTSHQSPPPAPPADLVVPDVPTPPPTGWKEYDSYFESLVRVHELAIDTTKTLTSAAVKELQTRAAALAKDADPKRQQSAQPRKMLVEQIKQLAEAPGIGTKSTAITMGAYRTVLMGSRDVIQMPGGDPTNRYADKINAMMMQLDNAMMHVGNPRQ